MASKVKDFLDLVKEIRGITFNNDGSPKTGFWAEIKAWHTAVGADKITITNQISAADTSITSKISAADIAMAAQLVTAAGSVTSAATQATAAANSAAASAGGGTSTEVRKPMRVDNNINIPVRQQIAWAKAYKRIMTSSFSSANHVTRKFRQDRGSERRRGRVHRN